MTPTPFASTQAMPRRWRSAAVLVAISIVGVIALLLAAPIPQDPSYHAFADDRRLLGVANFWNVISNLPFVAVGLFGLTRFARLVEPESRTGYVLLCAGVVLVGIGSSWYHLAPSNASLLWDRMPMTVAFMALFSMLLGERVVTRHKRALTWLLVAVGLAAALYWSWTESVGRGDLRPYALVQFLPIILMPLILLLYPARYLDGTRLLYAFGLYVLAKALEHFDAQVYLVTGILTGHPIKHVVAALAVFCIVMAVPANPPVRLSNSAGTL
ncbi:MAG: ceramidase [Pseudomonadota bacterium]|nr:ceramidase [Pseudomonadota bacterium]